jgi:hypothetical protein
MAKIVHHQKVIVRMIVSTCGAAKHRKSEITIPGKEITIPGKNL